MHRKAKYRFEVLGYLEHGAPRPEGGRALETTRMGFRYSAGWLAARWFRGNGALRKIGAVQEGILRRSFFRHGVHHDQVLWGIVAEDWRLQRLSQEPTRTTIN